MKLNFLTCGGARPGLCVDVSCCARTREARRLSHQDLVYSAHTRNPPATACRVSQHKVAAAERCPAHTRTAVCARAANTTPDVVSTLRYSVRIFVIPWVATKTGRSMESLLFYGFLFCGLPRRQAVPWICCSMDLCSVARHFIRIETRTSVAGHCPSQIDGMQADKDRVASSLWCCLPPKR